MVRMVAHVCASCDKESLNAKRCSGCHKIWYCSTRCQTSHWRDHVFDCKVGQPVSTVYYLSRAVRDRLIPLHAQTRLDYGFEKTHRYLGGAAQHMLLNVYGGLFCCGLTEKELRTWQKGGRLLESIRKAYEEYPPDMRGNMYFWLLEHQYLLDGTPLDEEDTAKKNRERAVVLWRDGWIAMGGSANDPIEEIESKIRALPEERRRCCWFYSLTRAVMHPSMLEVGWKDFGFVSSTQGTGEAGVLCRQYGELFERCTFEEFCAAYETSSIPDLLDRYGVEIASARFRDVMAESPRRFKSVWHLKHYIDHLITLEPDEELPKLIPPVKYDYGYVNCKAPAERKLLDDMYTRLFAKRDMDPLALYQACIKGKLLEFVKGFMKLAPNIAKYARLLENPYPLPSGEGLTRTYSRI